MSSLASQILDEKQSSFDNLSQKRILWDNAEKLFHNQLADSISEDASSKVFDPKLSTLTIERGYRVMAQLPTGKIKGISTNDQGDAKLKNLLLDKYVIPNANAQFDFLTKLRMVDIYSNIYGNFFVLIDQDIKQNGYVGPDMWLLNIRDVFPQVGAVSLEDSDQIIIRTWKPLSYFETLKKQDGFKNINKIITKLETKTGSKQNRDADATSKREEDQYPKEDPAKGKGYFEVLTRFERDRWVDICVDADLEFRDQKNPHDNGELPVECKYSIPLLDDFMGMGDFERLGSMQQAVNANWNLYFDAVKMSIFPPVMVNKDNVASISSLKPIPGAMWLGRNNIGNMAAPIQLNPQGVSTFNNTYQVANAAILNGFGTSDTAVSAETDAGMGKTPQALKMQASRENTRDNADRFYMEKFVSRVMKKMCNLMSKKQSTAIEFRMFPDEIEKIAREYPEVRQLYDENTGKLTVKPSESEDEGRGSTLYDYEIVSGSTYSLDQEAQQKNLEMLLTLWRESQSPQGNLLETKLKEEGFNFKFGELFKRIVSGSGIQDWDRILEEMTEEEKGQHVLQGDAQQFMSVLQQMGGQPDLNQIPAQPNQMPAMPMGNNPQAQI
jgi:hypothetical protein